MHDNFAFRNEDIVETRAIEEFKPDKVIHLAAITDAAGSFNRAEEVESVNYTATKIVAKACLETGVPMIHSSSTSVYGTQNDAVDEFCSLDELKPQSPYAETKLREEELMSKMHQEEGLQVITFRFGTIFGTSPGMRFHTAVNKFCLSAMMNEPLPVWSGALYQKRPYLSLRDAFKIIKYTIEKKFFKNQVYNILSNNYTVNDIVRMIKKYRKETKIKFIKSKILNQLSYEVSNKKISSENLNLNSKIIYDIKETLNLFKNINDGM